LCRLQLVIKDGVVARAKARARGKSEGGCKWAVATVGIVNPLGWFRSSYGNNEPAYCPSLTATVCCCCWPADSVGTETSGRSGLKRSVPCGSSIPRTDNGNLRPDGLPKLVLQGSTYQVVRWVMSEVEFQGATNRQKMPPQPGVDMPDVEDTRASSQGRRIKETT
jgi:hypothetical protein